MSTLEIIGTILIAYGCFTMIMGAVGVVRFPDFYTRLHAAGKGDTLGQGLVLLGLMFVCEGWGDGLKLGLIVFFIFILNATATHALARAGRLAGLKPWDDRWGPDEVQREGQMTEAEWDDLFLPVLAADHADDVAEDPAERDEGGDA